MRKRASNNTSRADLTARVTQPRFRLLPFIFIFAHSIVAAHEPMDLRGDSPAPESWSARFMFPSEARPDPQTLVESFQSVIDRLVRRVGRSVVAIEIDRSPGSLGRDAAEPRAWTSTGSGVLIRDDGMILTSQHVLADALAVHVILHDGRRCRGRVVSSDARADLAVVQIITEGLEAVEMGDVKNLRRGHFVFALGNPMGLAADGQAAVTMGLVSAIGRPLPGSTGLEEDRYYGDMIQTSAAIHPGHSGGPLVDIHGRLVGVLTAVSTTFGGGEGLAFAVPISARTRLVIARLLEGRPVEYGYLGVEVSTLSAVQRREAKVSADGGVLVDSVTPDGPARQTGLKRGDILLTVDDQQVGSADEFIQIVGSLEPGVMIDVAYLRAGEQFTSTLSVARRPPTGIDEGPRSIAFRGAVLKQVDSGIRQRSNLPEHALLVMMVGGDSAADRAGLSPGDVIVRIDGDLLSAESKIQLSERTDDCLIGLANGGSLIVRGP